MAGARTGVDLNQRGAGPTGATRSCLNCTTAGSLASNGVGSDDPRVQADDELRFERAYLDAAYDRVLAMRALAEGMAGTARRLEKRSAQALFERDSAIAHAGHRLAALDIAKDRLLVGRQGVRRGR